MLNRCVWFNCGLFSFFVCFNDCLWFFFVSFYHLASFSTILTFTLKTSSWLKFFHLFFLLFQHCLIIFTFDLNVNSEVFQLIFNLIFIGWLFLLFKGKRFNRLMFVLCLASFEERAIPIMSHLISWVRWMLHIVLVLLYPYKILLFLFYFFFCYNISASFANSSYLCIGSMVS